MTPAARTQAAIEILDAVIDAARSGGAAADTVVQRYFATRRYAGSKDRRAVRELVYAAVRACGEVPGSGRAAILALVADDPALAATFDGSAHGPAPIVPGDIAAATGVAPAWLIERLAAAGVAGAEVGALVGRAPLDLRANTLASASSYAVSGLPDGAPIAGLPNAIRLPAGTAIEATEAFRGGAIEVQDAGSQTVCLAVQASPGDRIVDLCAGAGGKTLALAAAMANDGAILASDTDRARLSRLMPRAERAGVDIVEARLLDPQREAAQLTDWSATADAVLVDAPCSGTGTWRRNPEARWRLTPDRLARLVATQRHVLRVGAGLVRPGGALVYVTCSLLDEEGADQVGWFLREHPDWRAERPDLPLGRAHRDGWRLTPANDGTDGFFVARLRAPC